MVIQRRGFLGLAALAVAAAHLTSCAADQTAEGVRRVGISMPTETTERWIQDGRGLRTRFEELGFQVILQYANDEVPTQRDQIDRMIDQGVEVLVITAVDGSGLGAQLSAAAEAGIKVIAYDRLIRDSEHVDFYVSFDNFEVGTAQAESLLAGLGIDEGAPGPFNIEIFAGSLDDNNSQLFFDGTMAVLGPHLDAGTLVVPSGEVSLEECAIQRWRTETAQQRMDDLLARHYRSETIHGVLSAYDGLSRGVITALKGRGYTEETMPVITGQDAEIASLRLILQGTQYSTIFKDTRLLSEQAVTSTMSLLAGEAPEANDVVTYDNGVKVVPSYLLDVVTVTPENLQIELIDSGYWSEQQIESGVG